MRTLWIPFLALALWVVPWQAMAQSQDCLQTIVTVPLAPARSADVTRCDLEAVSHLYREAAREHSPQKTLSRSQVAEMARHFGLVGDIPGNPHLGFLGGDISFFHEQHVKGYLSSRRLVAEFAARALVLEAAHRQGLSIPTSGDLSHASGRVVGLFLE